MKNKRVTQKRGIALLLAGSMMLSAGGGQPRLLQKSTLQRRKRWRPHRKRPWKV